MEGEIEEEIENLENEDFLEGQEPLENEDFLDNEETQDYEEGEYDFGGSEPEPLGGIYGLFKETLNRKDSLKVSNLNNEELGANNLSVRDCERIALISRTFHHPGVSNFFLGQSRIITDSAMSRKGWFAELFVTSKKYASRDSSSSVVSVPETPQKSNKWKIFSKRGGSPQIPQNP